MPRNKNLALKPGQLRARTNARLKLAGAVGWEFQRQKKDGLTSIQKIADRLGISRQAVHKILHGPGNWQIETMADLLMAMDREIDEVNFVPIGTIKKSNYQPVAIRAAREVKIVNHDTATSSRIVDGPRAVSRAMSTAGPVAYRPMADAA